MCAVSSRWLGVLLPPIQTLSTRAHVMSSHYPCNKLFVKIMQGLIKVPGYLGQLAK